MSLGFYCLVCKKRISKGFYFCNSCAIEHGMADENGEFYKPLDFPDWARELYNEERRRRRRELKISKFEVDLEYDEEHDGLDYGENGESEI